MVSGPTNSVVSTVGCQTVADTSMSRALTASGGWFDFNSARGIGAAQFDAEGEAADRLRGAGIDTPGLRLARLPAGDGAFEHARAVIPGAGPEAGENNDKSNQGGRPAAAPRNGSCLDHARCEARRMRRFKGCAVFSARRGRCPDWLRPQNAA